MDASYRSMEDESKLPYHADRHDDPESKHALALLPPPAHTAYGAEPAPVTDIPPRPVLDQNPSRLSSYMQQLYWLTRKNLWTARSHWMALVTVLVLPTLVVALMAIVNTVITNIAKNNSAVNYDSYTVPFDQCHTLDVYGLDSGAVPRCTSLVFAPYNDLTEEIVRTVIAGTNLDYDSDTAHYDSDTALFTDWNDHYGTRDVAVIFTNTTNNQFTYRIHYNRTRVDDGGRIRTLQYLLEHAMANAITRNISINYPLPSTTSESGSMAMPSLRVVNQDSLQFQTIPLNIPRPSSLSSTGASSQSMVMVYIGGPLFIFAGAIMSLILVQVIAKEKQEKLLAHMRMNGINESAYWLSYLLPLILILLLSSLLAVAVAQSTSVQQFKYVDAGVLILYLWISYSAMMAGALFLASLASKPRWVNLLSFLFLTMCLVVGWIFSSFDYYPTLSYYTAYAPGITPIGTIFFYALPFFHMDKIWSDLSTHSGVRRVANTTSSHLTYFPGPNTPTGYSGYFWPAPSTCGIDNVQQSYTFGMLTETQWQVDITQINRGSNPDMGCNWFDDACCSYMTSKYSPTGYRNNCYGLSSTASNLGWLVFLTVFYTAVAWYWGQIGDELGGGKRPYFLFQPSYWRGKRQRSRAVTAEEASLDTDTIAKARLASEREGSIRTVKISKAFQGTSAVKEVSIVMQPSEIFCLLGHNGSGKSTFINMITCMLSPTYGEAFVCGYSVRDDIEAIQSVLGVCPQDDLLWPSLTIDEHMRLQCAIRRVPSSSAQQLIDHLLAVVNLTPHRAQYSSALSGGQKRRLSIALALCGSPRCVLLDEPTTGMDPVHRHEVWDAIRTLKKDRVLLLTTHAMDEAQELGEQIAIMATGRIRAQGTAYFLKNKFGEGYELRLWIQQAMIETVESLIKSTIPQATIVGNSGGLMNIAVKRKHLKHIPVLFRAIDQLHYQQHPALREWSLSNSSLEEVFVRLAVADSTVNSGGHDSTGNDLLDDSKCTVCRKRLVADVTLYTANGIPITLANVMCRPCSFGPLLAEEEAHKEEEARALAARVDAEDREIAGSIEWQTDEAGNAVAVPVQLASPTHSDAVADGTARMTPLDLMGNKPATDFAQIRAIYLKNAAMVLAEKKSWIGRLLILIGLIIGVYKIGTASSPGTTCAQGQQPYGSGASACDPSLFYSQLFSRYPYSTPNVLQTQTVMAVTNVHTDWSLASIDIGRGVGQWNDSSWSGGSSPYQLEFVDWSTMITASGLSVHDQFVSNENYVQSQFNYQLSYQTSSNCYLNWGWVGGAWYVPNRTQAFALSQWLLPNGMTEITEASFSGAGQSHIAYRYHTMQPSDAVYAPNIVTDGSNGVQCTSPYYYPPSNDQLVMGMSRALLYSGIRNLTTYRPQGNSWDPTVDPNIQLTYSTLYGPNFSSAINALALGGICAMIAGISLLLLPWIADRIIYEREENLHFLMRIAGLKPRNYFVGNYLFDASVVMLWLIVTLIVAYASGATVVMDTNPAIFLLLFVVWTHGLISMAWFLAAFFKRRLLSQLVLHAVILVLVVWAFLWDSLLVGNLVYPQWLLIFPPTAYLRALSLILRYQQLNNDSSTAIVALFFLSCVWLFVGVMIHGLRYQTLMEWLAWLPPARFYLERQRQRQDQQVERENRAALRQSLLDDDNDSNGEGNHQLTHDPDVLAERTSVRSALSSPDSANQYAILIDDLRKTYTVFNIARRASAYLKGKVSSHHSDGDDEDGEGGVKTVKALRGLFLGVEYGETLGLLGPNGAGKSTTLSILSGLFPPTSGNAFVAGHSVINNLDAVYANLGICTQADFVYGDLTVQDHLLLYARIRGASRHQETALVRHVAELVNLDGDSWSKGASTLSGGQKRRLSLACSLVGNPRVWLLDEPTTGMSVEARRDIYAIIARQQRQDRAGAKKRAIIITTHSMEEADTLASRIAIVADGQLQAVGPQQRLKTRHGDGDKLTIIMRSLADTRNGNIRSEKLDAIQHHAMHTNDSADSLARVVRFICTDIYPTATLFHIDGRKVQFLLPHQSSAGNSATSSLSSLLSVFDRIDANQRRLSSVFHVEEWGLAHSSLEEVFINIVRQVEKENKKHV